MAGSSTVAAYHQMVKVWPLRGGVRGLTAHGFECELTPGLAGWMEVGDAAAADRDGSVQIMHGLRPKDLKTPEDASLEREPEPQRPAKGGKKRGRYKRRDLRAEEDSGPPVPFLNAVNPLD